MACWQTSSRGRSAHWPVNKVKGWGIVGSLSVRGDGRPAGPVRGALLDGGEDALHLEAVLERRRRIRARGDRGHQVPDLVREGVLPAEYVARRPPGGQVGMAGLGDRDTPETLLGRVIGTVAELQLVQPLQVERQAAAVAVKLDPQLVLAAGGEPGRLERG